LVQKAAVEFKLLQNWDLCAASRPASKIAECAANNTTEKNIREGYRLFITQALLLPSDSKYIFEQVSVSTNLH
jgi:hypothetical protein